MINTRPHRQASTGKRCWNFSSASIGLTLVLLLQAMTTTRALLLAGTIPDPVVHFSIGAVAGGCGAIAYQPFDYIKLQLQSSSSQATTTTTKRNGFECFVSTLQHNPTDLFKGVTVAVIGVAPEKAIKLGVNDILRDSWTKSFGGLPLWSQVAAGAVAGACQVLVSSPLDVLKVSLQQRPSSDTTGDPQKFPVPVVQVWNEIITTRGAGGLYKGYEACLVRDISFTAVCMPLYASLLEVGSNPFVAGAISGVVSTFIATPADMVKTRILTQSSTPKMGVGGFLESTFLENSIPPPPVCLQRDGTLTALAYQRNATMSFASTAAYDYGFLLKQEWIRDDNTVPAFEKDDNPFRTAKAIVEKEGGGVLFSGVYERCIGAVPRFGITLGVHEWLEHYAAQVGLLS